MPKPKPIDPALKAQALELAEQIGATEAGRQLDIRPGTIRMWQSRAGRVGAPSGSDPRHWLDMQVEIGETAAHLALEGLERAREELATGKPIEAERAAVAAGIALDKLTQTEARLEVWASKLDAISYKISATVAEVIKRCFDSAVSAVEISPADHDRLLKAFAEECRRSTEDDLRAVRARSHSVSTASELPAKRQLWEGTPGSYPGSGSEGSAVHVADSTASSVVDAQVEPDDPAQPENSPELCAVGPHPGRGWPTRPVSGSLSEGDLGEVVSGEILCDVYPKES